MPPNRQTIWRETVTELTDAGTLFRLDLNALAAYVAAVATHREATRLLEQSAVLLDRDGRPTANPALTIQTQAATTIANFGRQFGLTRHKAPDEPLRPAQPMQPPAEPDPRGRWCTEPHAGPRGRWECTGHRKNGDQCHGPVKAGLSTCRMHPGSGADVKHAAALLVRKVPSFGEPLDVSPGEALLGEVRRTAGIVAWIGQIVAALDQADIVWGVEKRTDRSGGDFPGADIIYSAKPNVWVSLYQTERKHLVATCEAALRANVDERLIRLAEMQGGRIVIALNGIFDDLGLTTDQRGKLPEVVPRRLRELTA
jgi:P27 family predicted phage terminase small subunit